MLEGHAANRAGELGRACGCFAAAFRLRALPSAGGAAALISLCNMRARQGHHEWCAHALLLLLCSARPLTERERAGVARLLGMPRHELPPVWTAVVLSQHVPGRDGESDDPNTYPTHLKPTGTR